jgi:hypothetical protein
MRMDANAGPNPIVLLGIGDGAIHLRRAVAIANRQHGGQAGLACPGEHFRAVTVELTALDVSVRIYVQGAILERFPGRYSRDELKLSWRAESSHLLFLLPKNKGWLHFAPE